MPTTTKTRDELVNELRTARYEAQRTEMLMRQTIESATVAWRRAGEQVQAAQVALDSHDAKARDDRAAAQVAAYEREPALTEAERDELRLADRIGRGRFAAEGDVRIDLLNAALEENTQTVVEGLGPRSVPKGWKLPIIAGADAYRLRYAMQRVQRKIARGALTTPYADPETQQRRAAADLARSTVRSALDFRTGTLRPLAELAQP